MKRITDQLLLIVYCFMSLTQGRDMDVFLVAFLAALLYACMNHYLRSEQFLTASAIIFMVLFLQYPEFVLFLPVILYSVLKHKKYILGGLLTAAGLIGFVPAQTYSFIYLAVGSAVAAALNLHTSAYEELDARFRKTRDDSVEKNLLLKEKNRSLLERQDYEVYTATLKERNRIAREIHDNVGHMLSRAILMVGAIRTINKEAALKEPVNQLEETLNMAMTSIRKSVHDLHDESVNLKGVLESLAESFAFCPVKLKYDMGCEIPREVKYSFISIVREALSNVVKHSDASQVKITVREHPGMYQLVIEDNGTGSAGSFQQEAGEQTGIGLQNMKDRVEKLSGIVKIRPENGFRIYITVPKGERTV